MRCQTGRECPGPKEHGGLWKPCPAGVESNQQYSHIGTLLLKEPMKMGRAVFIVHCVLGSESRALSHRQRVKVHNNF